MVEVQQQMRDGCGGIEIGTKDDVANEETIDGVLRKDLLGCTEQQTASDHHRIHAKVVGQHQ
jgi:hypothetical protein